MPDEGRVRSVVVGGRSIAMTRCGGRLGALENHCPHQGGPLGEGSIEKGLLRCPWHGYDYDPVTGAPAGRGLHDDDRVPAYDVEERDDGVSWPLPPKPRARAHRGRRPGRDPRRPGRRHRVRDGRPLQPRLRRCAAPGRGAGRAALRRHPPRGRGSLRRERLRQAHRTARGAASPSPGPARPTSSPGSTTPSWTAPRWWPSPARCRRRCSAAAPSRTSTSARSSATSRSRRPTVQAGSDHAELAALAVKHARRRPRGRAPGAARRGAGPALAGPGRLPRRPLLAARRSAPTPAPWPRATDLVAAARRPVIVVGHGARGARDEVIALAEQLGAPVLTTFKAKGLVPDTPPARAPACSAAAAPRSRAGS